MCLMKQLITFPCALVIPSLGDYNLISVIPITIVILILNRTGVARSKLLYFAVGNTLINRDFHPSTIFSALQLIVA
jgi:hypothetical protein